MRRGKAWLLVLLASLLLAPAARADIAVSTASDETTAGDGMCSLREAVSAAGGGTAPDCPGAEATGQTIITLPAGTYRLTLGGALQVGGDVALQGAGADPAQTAIDAGGSDRALITSGRTSLVDLTITGGRAPSGSPGIGGTAGQPGANGGGVLNTGSLTLTNVVVSANNAGAGGAGSAGTGGVACSAGAAGGNGGLGGGIYSTGTLTLVGSTITGNRSGDGGDGGVAGDLSGTPTGGCAGGDGGDGGAGGAVFSSGQTTIVNTSIIANHAGGGGAGGAGGAGTVGGPGGNGGAGGGGAGIGASLTGATLGVSGSTIAANGGGAGGDGGSGGSGYLSGGSGATGGAGGEGGAGAGVLVDNGLGSSSVFVNSTIADNRAGGGGRGGAGGSGSGASSSGGPGGAGGRGADGGGLYTAEGSSSLRADTISGDVAGIGGGSGAGGAGQGSAAPGAPGAPGSAGAGGGIAVDTTSVASVLEQDTIVAAGGPEDCSGPVSDAGYDLSFPDSSCPHSIAADPKLGPLGSYGGPTATVSLRLGSAAIDALPASGAGCPNTDQRGVIRPKPAGGACDIGAYEYAALSCRPVSASARSGQPVIIPLSCGDPAHLPIQYTIVQAPAHGRLRAQNTSRGVVTYTANARFTGTDRFTYRGVNANGTATIQSVTVKVTRPPLVIAAVRLSKRRFRAGEAVRFQFLLSAAASVQIAIMRRAEGHAVPVGTLSAGRKRAGRRTVPFDGVIGGVALARGRYRATLSARAGSRRSKPVSVTFVIVP